MRLPNPNPNPNPNPYQELAMRLRRVIRHMPKEGRT